MVHRRLLSRLTFDTPIVQMTNDFSQPPSQLGVALAQALDRAVGTSLNSLDLLREAIRSYAMNQRARGVPLDHVMVAVGGVLMDAEDERIGKPGLSVSRDPDLARQLRAWCSEYYMRSPATPPGNVDQD